jgi:Protein of unknown function (DUF3365)
MATNPQAIAEDHIAPSVDGASALHGDFLAELERALIVAYLRTRGYSLRSLHNLPADEALEARIQYLDAALHGTPDCSIAIDRWFRGRSLWKRIMRRYIPVLLVAGLTGSTAFAQQPTAFKSWPLREAPAELGVVITQANSLVATMEDALVQELNDALDRGGPTRAFTSCHLNTIGVIMRVGREGIAAGRTSDRLRSPTNAPPPWAAPFVQANAGRRARDVDGFAVDLGDKVGVLRPIAHRPMCAGCHGPSDQISPVIHQALADRYPSDRAIGFTEGEIRGWFWVAMPKQR